MAGSRVKGITIEINGETKGLEKALSSVNSQATKTNSELKDVNKLLKLDPGNTTLVAQKYELLTKSVSQTEEKLKILESTEGQVKAAFEKGDIGEAQYRSFQRELEATRADLEHVEQGAKDTGNYIKGLDDDASKAEAGFKKMGSATNTATRELQESESKAKRFGETFKGSFLGNLGANIVTNLASDVTMLGGDMMKEADATQSFKRGLLAQGFGKSFVEKTTEDLENFSMKTGVSFNALQASAKKFAGEGVKDFADVTTGLATLNKASGGTEQSFTKVSTALTKTESSGKVTTATLTQLFKNMPSAVQPIEKELMKLGKYGSLDQLKQGMADGKVSAEMLNKAISDVGNSDAMTKAAGKNATFEGSMTKIKNAAIESGAKLIEAFGSGNLSSAVDSIIGAIQKVTKILQNIINFVKSNSSWLVPLAAGLIAVVSAISLVTTAITVWTTVQAALDVSLLPFIAVIVAIVAVIALVVVAIQHWGDIVNWLKGVWSAISGFFSNLWDGIVQIFNTAVSAISNFLQSGFGQAVLLITMPFLGVINFFVQHWTQVQQIFTTAMTAISNFLTNTWNAISNTITTVMNTISSIILSVWNGISSAITAVVAVISSVISITWNAIKTTVTTVMNTIHSIVSSVWNTISSIVSNVVHAISSTISSVWNGIKNAVTNVMNGIKGTVSSVWNGISSTVSSVVHGVSSTVSSVFNGLKGIVSGAMNGVKSTISGIISTIKGLFNFHLSFPSISIPHIPLPHFGISGSFNPLKGQIPHLSVDWYANGGVFTKPTLFATGSGVKGVGEAGPEAVLPLNAATLAGIGRGVGDSMNLQSVATQLGQLVSLMSKQGTPGNSTSNITMNVTWNGKEDIVKTMQQIGVQMKYNQRGLAKG